MDNSTFGREIGGMFREAKRAASETTPFSEDQIIEHDANVHAFIDSVYPVSTVTEVAANHHYKSGVTGVLKSWLTLEYVARSAFAIACMCLVAVGVISLLPSGSSSQFMVLPESIAEHVPFKDTASGFDESKAIFQTESSARRQAFVTGVGRAAVDLTGVGNDEYISLLNSNTVKFAETEETEMWLVNGFTVEVVRLASLRTLQDMDTSIVESALSLYKNGNRQLALESEDVAELFMMHHKFLLNVSGEYRPADIENIVKATEQMKVVLR